MFITSREKNIINLIVRTSGKHTVSTLSSFLNVSGRTVQRDLKSIEKILDKFHLQLKRTANDGLFIEGKNEDIYKLIQNLATIHPTDITPEERKLNLLLTLLHEGPSFKIQGLAHDIGVSGATLATYVDELAEWLRKFSIKLIKKRGVGIELIAEEANKRHALASYILVYFYEVLIDSLYQLQQGKYTNKEILGYFSPRDLLMIDQLVNQKMQKMQKDQARLADSDYIGLIVHICITIQRTKNNYVLTQEYDSENEITAEFLLIDNICNELEEKLYMQISKSDRHFLTVILKGSKVQVTDVVLYDSVHLGKLIKKVIEDISTKLHVNLSHDFSLYQGLLAHMEPSIFRIKQKLDIFNPLTDEIKRKYPVLFMAVKKSLEQIFIDIDFPEDEVAFIVLHFGSALLMNEEEVKINAVVVCPTGIGASKMLASRIQKELMEIKDIEILSINDFQSATLDEYDVVISTVRLPFTNVDYILVSPLLREEDIDTIKSYLQNNIEKVTRKKNYLNKDQKDTFKHDRTDVKVLLQEIKDVQSSMDSILNNLRVVRKQNVGDHWDTIKEVVQDAEQEGLHTNTSSVVQHLMARERQGGLGIPNTNMALFHCRDIHIKELIFQIAHIDTPYIIKGMDGQEVQMKSLLLMLAPVHMSEREQEILSMISTSLIESDVSMMIYSSSNEALIRRKLEDLFLDYLQNNLIKE
ncbi:BglG family transcription antiterminator [Sutcliffiella cohnii]